jgi:methionyl aminopeptidase
MSMSFSVGATSKEANRLILGTKEALNVGINAAKVGNYIGDISYAIQTVAQKYGFGIVRDLSGHGVGYAVHEEPSVYNFGKPKSGPAIVEGMVLAIEPMFTLGGADIRISRDKWTVVTADESLAAHWEHTIAIVDGLPKILTVALK